MRSEAWQILAAVALGVAIFVAAFVALRAPTRQADRLGRRGKKRRRAIATNPTWASLEPFVRWLGVRLSGFVPERLACRIDREILLAGDFLGLVPEEYVALTLLSGALGAAFGAVIDLLAHSHGLATLGGLTIGLVSFFIDVSKQGQERLQRVSRGLPYAVDLMSLGMSAGLDFPASMREVVDRALPGDPLAEEFEYVLQNLALGHTRREALRELAVRVPAEPVVEFVETVVHAEEKGNPLADVLVIQAHVSRQRRTTRAEEAAAKAGVKLIIPLGFVFLALMILILGPVMLRALRSFGG